MAMSNISSEEALDRTHYSSNTNIASGQINNSAVSWAAILAGAAAAAALTLILLLLGTGIGLSSVSPWSQQGMSATALGVSTIVWLTITQILAAGMGGYLAGRLRHRWANVLADEVYFRDTAHGFLTWSVATIATAILIISVVGSIFNSGVQAASTVTAAATTAAVTGGIAAAGSAATEPSDANGTETMGYFVDVLFRKDASVINTTSIDQIMLSPDAAKQPPATAEVTRIFANSMDMKALPKADLTYLSQLVSNHTGLTQQEAEKRVNDTYTSMQAKLFNAEIAVKDAADKARKASIYSTLWLFASLLMGAFSASLAATWGGRCRDA